LQYNAGMANVPRQIIYQDLGPCGSARPIKWYSSNEALLRLAALLEEFAEKLVERRDRPLFSVLLTCPIAIRERYRYGSLVKFDELSL
jgi:hypothetical protein